MNNILQINSSIHNGNGESSKLAAEFVAQMRVGNPRAKVVVRDVAKNPLPHLDAPRNQGIARARQDLLRLAA